MIDQCPYCRESWYLGFLPRDGWEYKQQISCKRTLWRNSGQWFESRGEHICWGLMPAAPVPVAKWKVWCFRALPHPLNMVAVLTLGIFLLSWGFATFSQHPGVAMLGIVVSPWMIYWSITNT